MQYLFGILVAAMVVMLASMVFAKLKERKEEARREYWNHIQEAENAYHRHIYGTAK